MAHFSQLMFQVPLSLLVLRNPQSDPSSGVWEVDRRLIGFGVVIYFQRCPGVLLPDHFDI